MTLENSSKKQIVKSSAIIGSASFLTILIGLVNVKFFALLLGPTGIGFMGVLTTIMASGTIFFGMGLATSGVRELALNNKNTGELNLVRKALFSANFTLGLVAIIFIFIFKKSLSEFFFQSADYQLAFSVIAVGVFFSLILNSQMALFQGLRKINELAKIKVLGALLATFIGLLIIWRFGEAGVPFFVITVPLVTCFIALYYSRKLPCVTTSTITIGKLSSKWRNMLFLGFAFMLTALMGVGSQLIVRYIINYKLNIESVGYFQASWQISMTYINFVLGAMAADYYPRLTQVIQNKKEANLLVKQQTEIAIIFAAPVLLMMLTFAPLVINLLYSNEFIGSIEILRWQVLGDVFKIISWPLGFIILAKGYSKVFFCTELIWNAIYILFVYFGIDIFGIEITGYAFAVSYLIYLFIVYVVVKKCNDFQWSKNNLISILLLTLASSSLLLLSYVSLPGVMVLGVILVSGATVYAIKTVGELGIKNRKLEKALSIYKRLTNS